METSAPAKKPPAIVTAFQRIIRRILATKPARAFLLYQEHHGPILADSVTYRALFSVFAGVFLGFAIAGLWLAGNTDAMAALVSALDSAIPGLVGDGGLIDPDDLVQPLAFGFAGALALVGLIGTAIGAIGSLRIAFRTLADQPADTTFFLWVMLRDLALAVAFGLALAAAAAVTFLSTGALGVVFDWLGIGSGDEFAGIATRVVSIAIIFLIDTLVVAMMVRFLSGLRPSARSLWSGAVIGGAGLTVLQVLSSLFIGGASSNPLFASFGSVIALLIWFNFSSQVILIAAAYIVTGVDEEHDRVAARFGSPTPAVRRVRTAERRAAVAARELSAAREAEAAERETR